MKLKGKIIIPLIALLIAMLMLGTAPVGAADTSAPSDELTYIPPTPPPTSSLDEEIEGFIKDNLGDDIKEAEGPLRNFSEMMSEVLTKIKNFLNTIIETLTGVGGLFGGSTTTTTEAVPSATSAA